jgi:isoquinoline 1-oxidoreductase beta subunit
LVPSRDVQATAGFDADKNLTALHIRISGQSILATVAPARMQEGRDPATFQGFFPGGAEAAIGYGVPNILVDHSMRNPHIHPGFWRGVNINHNAIYLECFMDELAKEAGMDPLEFRRKIMAKHPAPRVAQRRGREDRLGHAAELSVIAASPSIWASAWCRAAAEGRSPRQVKVHRIVGVTRATP